MWKHSDKNSDLFSLHDCHATRMFCDQNDLYFEYSDGFWITPKTEHNSNIQTLRTDKSQLKICNYDCSYLYIFEDIEHLGKQIVQRVSFPLEMFMKHINSGVWKLEFLCEYHTYRGVLFDCWVWSKDEPYHRECQLQIACDDIEYFWDNLCEDNPW